MKLQYTTKNGRITVELEADSQAEMWKQLAEFQEVFEEDITYNGKTSDEVKYVVRQDTEENEYFEKHYAGSDNELMYVKKAYGQMKKPKGRLFPKRKTKDADGNEAWIGKMGNNCWVKYNKETGKEE